MSPCRRCRPVGDGGIDGVGGVPSSPDGVPGVGRPGADRRPRGALPDPGALKGNHRPVGDRALVRRALSKVPEVTAIFWITWVLTTGMGESTSEYLVRNGDPVLAVLAGAVVLAAVLVLQFEVRRYLASVYWSAVVMVSVCGTMAADALHIRFATTRSRPSSSAWCRPSSSSSGRSPRARSRSTASSPPAVRSSTG